MLRASTTMGVNAAVRACDDADRAGLLGCIDPHQRADMVLVHQLRDVPCGRLAFDHCDVALRCVK